MRTLLVTGSSRGIGKAIATLAHERGYRVVLHGRSDSDELRATNAGLPGSLITHFDVADRAGTEAAVAEVVDEVGVIDVLINNAGVTLNRVGDVSEVDDDLAIQEYKVNVLGTMHCVQAVLPGMLAQGSGSVVNMSSIKGHANLATMSTFSYAPAKAGVISITKSLAKAYSPRGVRFNVVSPGYVETDQVEDWDDVTFDRINNGTLLSRMAKPEEVAPLVMFLASDDASYITGGEFLIDGGYALKGK